MSLGRIGAFLVEQPLGAGAMGRVYAARHESLGEAVALKVLSAQPGPEALSELRREVNAMASLTHPHILAVFDHGVVTEHDTCSASVGSPWLVVEKASGGSLATRPPSHWEAVRVLLDQLLDALAHAHARGVIHRDLKLANLLLCGDQDRRPGLKLADFGVAWSMGAQGPRVAGSPHSMAPEQSAGATWALGPATDLYSVGCIAWELATGRPVFADRPSSEQARAHRDDPPPLFEPCMAVPVELEGWIRWLLEKSAQDRPGVAADARHGLGAIGAVMRPAEVEREVPTHQSSTPTFTFSHPGLGLPLPLPEPLGLRGTRAPFATRWDRDEPPFPLHLLAGVGASLFGVRTVPFVSRRAEREAIWATLGEAVEHGAPTAVTIEAPAGLGGTRLATWAGERAHELGAAVVWRGGPGGLVGLLTRGLNLADVPSQLRATALRNQPHGAAILAAIEGTHPDPVGVTLGVLARLAMQRPVLLVLDDVHRTSELVDLALRIIQTGDAGPIMVCAVLATAKDEPASVTSLKQAARRLSLSPLDDAAMAALLRGALGLSAAAVGVLQVRSGGHPGFALALVRDWVADGVLVVGPDGFEVPRGRLLAIPDATRLWRARLERVSPRWSPAALEAGWIAAALGPGVDAELWRTVVARLGEEWAPEALDELVREGLATRGESGWTLAHPLLREAWLETRSEDARRIRLAHIAAVVGALDDASLLAGRLWLEAGRPATAHGALLRAAEDAARARRYAIAEAALSRRDDALDALEVPATDVLRLEGDAVRMRVLCRSGRTDAGLALARRVAAQVDDPRWRRECGKTAFMAGQWAEAEAWLRDGGDADAQTQRLLGQLAWQEDDRARAWLHNERALGLALAADNRVEAGASANNLGNLARYGGDLDGAAAYFQQSLDLVGAASEAVVVKLNLAWLQLDRGEVERGHALLGELLDDLEAVFDRYLLVGAASMRVYSSAMLAAEVDFDASLERCRQLAPLVARHAHNTAKLLADAGALWRDRGDTRRADLTHRLAWDAASGLLDDQCEAFRATLDTGWPTPTR